MRSNLLFQKTEPQDAGRRIVIAGGGAAGFFGAIVAAEADPGARVLLLEKGAHLLAKVRVSGGGRCNVTHACFEPRELATRYPRGGRALIGPLTRFGPRETVAWFQSRGVVLKTEEDGRMFPVTDSSQTILDCLMSAAEKAGVEIRISSGVRSIARESEVWCLQMADGSELVCDRLLWAGGGCRPGENLVEALGHKIVPPVPSLFTFQVDLGWLRELSGVSLESAEVSVPGTGLKQTGPLLLTHLGVSGPAVLKISAWGARQLHAMKYRFTLVVKWLPGETVESLLREMQRRRETIGAQTVARSRMGTLPSRLWEQLLGQAGIPLETRWSKLSRGEAVRLAGVLSASELPVSGKSTNKEEFVTCGGVALSEVDFKTMESRLVPGLYFAGEALDIDGITGGYNFQAAWTTGWIAGNSMAREKSG